MCIKNLFPSLVMFFMATVLSAAEPETKPQTIPTDQAAATIPAESAEPVIPKRELKFDASEEEVPLPLENMREGMLDQRCVATFKLVLPKIEKPAESSPGGGSVRPRMNGLYEIGSYTYLGRNVIRGLGSRTLFEHLIRFEELRNTLLSRPSQMVLFSLVSKDISENNARYPEEARLPKDIIDSIMWENPPFIEIENNLGTDTTGITNRVEVRLLAPTDKQARQWVENGWPYTTADSVITRKKSA
jgi:hypothetical protein